MGKARNGKTSKKHTMLVKENASASNEPINIRDTIIVAISVFGYVSLSSLTIIVIF